MKAPKDTVLHTGEVNGTRVEFVFGSALNVQCQGIIIPVIMEGEDKLRIDYDVITEFRDSQYQ